MDDKFWEFINNHWVFSQKEKPIESMTSFLYEMARRHQTNYEGAYIDLLSIFEDYIEFVNK